VTLIICCGGKITNKILGKYQEYMSTCPVSPQDEKQVSTSISYESIQTVRNSRRQLAPKDQFPTHHIPEALSRQLQQDYASFEKDFDVK
jgi:hypothetical protein